MREFNLTESIILTLKEDRDRSGSSLVRLYLNDKKIDGDYLRKRSFDNYCDMVEVWLDKNYDMNIISDNDADVLIHLLLELYRMNEPKARQIYKVQVGNIIKNAEYSDYLYKIVIDEGFLTELSSEEIVRGVLNADEAEILLEIQTRTRNTYHLVIEFEPNDEVRRRIYPDRYYYSTHKGHLVELDLELNRSHAKIPDTISKLKNLENLHIFMPNVWKLKFASEWKLKSMKYLYIYSSRHIDVSHLKDYFPNAYIRR